MRPKAARLRAGSTPALPGASPTAGTPPTAIFPREPRSWPPSSPLPGWERWPLPTSLASAARGCPRAPPARHLKGCRRGVVAALTNQGAEWLKGKRFGEFDKVVALWEQKVVTSVWLLLLAHELHSRHDLVTCGMTSEVRCRVANHCTECYRLR